jgi:hypothetical protein
MKITLVVVNKIKGKGNIYLSLVLQYQKVLKARVLLL